MLGGAITNDRLMVVVMVVFSLFVHSSVSRMSREAVHDDPFVVYPYRLTSTSPFGKIQDDALPGSQVPVDSSLPHFDFSEDRRYLTLDLQPNALYVSQTNESNGTTISKMQKPAIISKHHSSTSTNSSKYSFGNLPAGANLPEGVRIDISDEKGTAAQVNEKLAFTLDENLHIVVENPRRFKDVDGIEFWVVAIKQEKGQRDRVVSNPLSFVVKIDHSQTDRQGAPVYAGIVVLVVCLIALLIPLTVRTKRRLREGKPICVCGSSRKKLEERQRKEEAETGTGSGTGSVPRKQETEAEVLAGPSSIEQNELAMILLEGRSRSVTVPRHGKTLQSRYLTSVSQQHFQPHWLDPHYNEVYERPVFATPTTPRVPFINDVAQASTSRSGENQTKL